MSVTAVLIKCIGAALAIVGLLLLLSVVGLNMGVGLEPWYFALILGVVFLGAGIWIIRGGTVTA